MELSDLLVRGDMPGDSLLLTPEKVARAERIFEFLGEEGLREPGRRLVLAVSGPSGSGKSETASVLATRFVERGRGAYVLSCDNYAIRPPRDNEQHRKELFERGGREALEQYLGTEEEILFERLRSIVTSFEEGARTLELRFMDNAGNRVQDEAAPRDMEGIEVLVIEGTWSCLLRECNRIFFLETDHEATLEHRRQRARDPLTPFGETVLVLEQEKLRAASARADHIVSLDGEIRSP